MLKISGLRLLRGDITFGKSEMTYLKRLDPRERDVDLRVYESTLCLGVGGGTVICSLLGHAVAGGELPNGR